MKMRNPFQGIGKAFNSIFKNRKKIEQEQAKVKGTKKETARSTSGGGGTKQVKVSNDDKPVKKPGKPSRYARMRELGMSHYKAKGRTKEQLKRRKRRKIAKASRRINRICRQNYKKVA